MRACSRYVRCVHTVDVVRAVDVVQAVDAVDAVDIPLWLERSGRYGARSRYNVCSRYSRYGTVRGLNATGQAGAQLRYSRASAARAAGLGGLGDQLNGQRPSCIPTAQALRVSGKQEC
jgi:hypothetical protein